MESKATKSHTGSTTSSTSFDFSSIQSLDDLCRLPSMLYDHQIATRSTSSSDKHSIQHLPAKQKMDVLIDEQQQLWDKVYSQLGYIITHMLIHEATENHDEVIDNDHESKVFPIPCQLFYDHLQEKADESYLASSTNRMHCLEYSAFQVGIISCLLDCMDQSTRFYEEHYDGGHFASLNSGFEDGNDRVCIVNNGPVLTDFTIQFMIQCLFQNR